MLKSWLRLVRAAASAVAVASRGLAAAATWFTGLRTIRVNGRSWSRIGPVVRRKSGLVSRSAGPSAWADGIRARLEGPSTSARRPELASAPRVAESAPGARLIAARSDLASRAKDLNTASEEETKPA